MSIVSDLIVMPDRYSTGIERGVNLVNILDICAEAGITVSNNRLDLKVNVKNALLNQGFAEVTDDNVFVINGVYFCETCRVNISAPSITEYKTYRFKNCKFDGGNTATDYIIGINLTTDSTITTKWHYLGEPIEFIHCEFTGPASKSAIISLTPTIFDHCYAYNLGCDAFPTDNPKSQRIDCYACKAGMLNTFNGTSTSDAHADFIQTSGEMDRLGGDYIGTSKAYIRRCRSDIIQYHDSDGTYYMSNASSYNDCDFGNINLDIDYMWASGGNYNYRFEITKSPYVISGKATNLVAGARWYKNNHIANGCTVEVDVKDADTLLVGSVWVDGDDIKVSVTNYLTSKRSFKIETNLGYSDELTIAASPDQTVLCENSGGTYTFGNAVSWDDFPYDKIYTIPSDGVDWVRVYDVTNGNNILVRTQVISEDISTTEFNTVKDLFKGICDAIRAKDGTTGFIKHSDIPQRILNLNVSSKEDTEV